MSMQRYDMVSSSMHFRSDLLMGPDPASPSCSPTSETVRLRQQVQLLQRQLAAADESCKEHQRQQSASAQRAGEAQQQLQKRGELILQLQAQLSAVEGLNFDLRSQMLQQSATNTGTGSSGSARRSSSSSSSVTADPQLSPDHVRKLQQQIAAQAAEIEALQKERAGAQGLADSGTGSSTGSNGLPRQAAASMETGQHSPPAVEAEVGFSTAESTAAGSLNPGSNEEALAEDVVAAASTAHMALLKQHEELEVYVQQLEGQAMQREALLGGLLAQVSAAL
eukprot:gene5805-6045_t